MKHTSILFGLGATAVILAVMALARLLVGEVRTVELEVREVEISTLPEPPPPPPDDPPPEAPPPPPALSTVEMLPDPTRVAVPRAEIPMDLKAPVDPFFTDLTPAPLPQPERVVARATPKPAVRSTPRPTPTPPPPPRRKEFYSASELDGTPRLIRHGSTQFPTALARRGVSQGTVTFEVELSTRGSVTIRRVVSASYPELIPAARRVAAQARFTPPTRQGQPVKAIMRWPIVIRK